MPRSSCIIAGPSPAFGRKRGWQPGRNAKRPQVLPVAPKKAAGKCYRPEGADVVRSDQWRRRPVARHAGQHKATGNAMPVAEEGQPPDASSLDHVIAHKCRMPDGARLWRVSRSRWYLAEGLWNRRLAGLPSRGHHSPWADDKGRRTLLTHKILSFSASRRRRSRGGGHGPHPHTRDDSISTGQVQVEMALRRDCCLPRRAFHCLTLC